MNIGFFLASLNATLNGTAFLLLLLGYQAIRAKNVPRHKVLMGLAFATSCLFLISYLTRFYLTGTHRYPGDGWMRTLYLAILITHTSLAAIVPFLAIRTIYLAVKNRITAHRRLARWTLPIWMYVSFTGVVIYFMLYH